MKPIKGLLIADGGNTYDGEFIPAEKVRKLVEALTKGINSPHNLCALMAEGEGDNPGVYRTMAKSAFDQMTAALKELGDL